MARGSGKDTLDALSDLGVPRPPVVLFPGEDEEAQRAQYEEYVAPREKRFNKARLEAHRRLMELSIELAKQDLIPRGSYEDQPHSAYVAEHAPRIYRALIANLERFARDESTYAVDGQGRALVFISVQTSPLYTVLEVVDVESNRCIGSFPLADFESHAQLQRLWLETNGNRKAILSAAKEGSPSREQAAWYDDEGNWVGPQPLG